MGIVLKDWWDKMITRDFYVNVAELMSDVDVDRAEELSELPIVGVTGSDVIYHD